MSEQEEGEGMKTRLEEIVERILDEKTKNKEGKKTDTAFPQTFEGLSREELRAALKTGIKQGKWSIGELFEIAVEKRPNQFHQHEDD